MPKKITCSFVEGKHPDRNRAAVDALVKQLLAPANNQFPGDSPKAQHSFLRTCFIAWTLSRCRNGSYITCPVQSLSQLAIR